MKAVARVMLVWLFIALLPAFGHSSATQWPIAPETIPTENDVLRLAAADILTLPPFDRQYQRFLWVVPSETLWEDSQATVLALNYVSRSTIAVHPIRLGANKLMLLRFDLRMVAPKDRDLEEWTRVFEEFRFDPRFSLLLTKDTLKFAAGIDLPKSSPKQVTTKKKRFFKDQQLYSSQGKTLGYYDEKTGMYSANPWVEETVTETVGGGLFSDGEDVVRVVAPHLDPVLVATLVEATLSQAPVISSDYFIFRALSTIRDVVNVKNKVFDTIFGGRYPDLVGIKRGAKKGTDLDVLLQDLGVGNVEKGITAQKIFEELRSDARVAVVRSEVTGKPRRIDFLRTLSGRVVDNQGIISITHDLKDSSVDVGQDPVANLLAEQIDDGREVLWELANGLMGGAAFNGAGKFVDEVPPDIANDTTIPGPHGGRLQAIISCLGCHAKAGGWMYVQNDALKLLKAFDAFGDKSLPGRSVPDQIDRLAGLFSGNPEGKLLPRMRDDLASAVLKAIGPWKSSKKAQTDIVGLSHSHLRKRYNDWWYGTIDAKQALFDLGIAVKDAKDAPAILKKMLPPVPVVQINDGNPFIAEDYRIGLLVTGVPLNRAQYSLVAPLIKFRVKVVKK
jgi:hypothetical protein